LWLGLFFPIGPLGEQNGALAARVKTLEPRLVVV
jgi:hypothetical protein